MQFTINRRGLLGGIVVAMLSMLGIGGAAGTGGNLQDLDWSDVETFEFRGELGHATVTVDQLDDGDATTEWRITGEVEGSLTVAERGGSP